MTIQEFVPPAWAKAQVARAEQLGFSPAEVRTRGGAKRMTRVRDNERCAVTDPDLAGWLWQRLAPLLGQLELPTQPVAVAEFVRYYKYLPGQRFLGHRDGNETQGNFKSRLSFLVYLNAGYTGGETRFKPHRKDAPQPEVTITPRVGQALLFEHHHWHEGARVLSGVKYVLRSDILCLPN